MASNRCFISAVRGRGIEVDLGVCIVQGFQLGSAGGIGVLVLDQAGGKPAQQFTLVLAFGAGPALLAGHLMQALHHGKAAVGQIGSQGLHLLRPGLYEGSLGNVPLLQIGSQLLHLAHQLVELLLGGRQGLLCRSDDGNAARLG
jgi:hypothetical protein